jgi:protein tyrosine phosphatase type IVA
MQQQNNHSFLDLYNDNIINDSSFLSFNLSGTCYRFTSKYNFIIYLSSMPTSSSIEQFSQFMKEHGADDIFCFCVPEYDPSIFSKFKLNFHNLELPDGSTPTINLLKRFDQIIDQRIKQTSTKQIIINVHCRTGMGRAPTFIAYLMITRGGIDPFNSIDIIRKQRRGCFNSKQLNWITNEIKKKKYRDIGSCVLI